MSALEASSNGLDLNRQRSSASDMQSMFASFFPGSGLRRPGRESRVLMRQSSSWKRSTWAPSGAKKRSRSSSSVPASNRDHRANNLRNLEDVCAELRSKGFNRSTENVHSLFFKVASADENKNYLNLKSDCSASDLNAIMADYYASENYEREKLTGNAHLGKRDPPNVVTNLKPEFDRSTRIFGLRPTERSFTRLAAGEEPGDLRDHKRLKL